MRCDLGITMPANKLADNLFSTLTLILTLVSFLELPANFSRSVVQITGRLTELVVELHNSYWYIH